jgi:hypothetical protein
MKEVVVQLVETTASKEWQPSTRGRNVGFIRIYPVIFSPAKEEKVGDFTSSRWAICVSRLPQMDVPSSGNTLDESPRNLVR